MYFASNLIQEHISFLKYHSIQSPKVHFRGLINHFDGKYTTNGASLRIHNNVKTAA
jgi:hypothetical protein